jgi:hypothetical protein
MQTHLSCPLPRQAIFLGAAGVSALATLAFLFFVPSHPNGAATAAAAPAAQQQGSSSTQQQQAQSEPGHQQQKAGLGEQAAALWRDVRSMGADFYRTLGVIGLYGLGHINESMLEARAIEVRPRACTGGPRAPRSRRAGPARGACRPGGGGA